MATLWPAVRARCNKSGTAENGRTSGRYFCLNVCRANRQAPVHGQFGFGQKEGNELLATLTDLAARLLETDIVPKPDQRFMPGYRVQIDGIEQCPVQIENAIRHSATAGRSAQSGGDFDVVGQVRMQRRRRRVGAARVCGREIVAEPPLCVVGRCFPLHQNRSMPSYIARVAS